MSRVDHYLVLAERPNMLDVPADMQGIAVPVRVPVMNEK